MTLIRRGLVTLLMLTAVLMAPPATAQETAITWGITPVPQDHPAGDGDRVSFRAELDPGEEFTDEVVVTNYSQRSATFRLDASDGTINEAGDFDILPSDQVATGGGAWIELDQEEVNVGPRESITVGFTLRVPDDALAGDHPAGITVSLAASAAADDQVTFDARVGVRVHLRVNGEIEPRLDITELTTEFNGSWNPFGRGTLTVSWTVTNVGNVRLGSAQELDARGPWGFGLDVSDRLVGDQREILPGQSVSGRYEADAWPVFRVGSTVTATPRIVGDDRIDVPLAPVAADAATMAMPWPQLLIVALIALLATLIIRRRRAARADRARLERELAEARGGHTLSASVTS